MIKWLFLPLLCAFFITSHTQTIIPVKDAYDISFNGYDIDIFKKSGMGNAYHIFLKNVPVLHQDTNPYFYSIAGFKKEDATAKWLVIHLIPGNRQKQIPKQHIPVEIPAS